MRAGRSRVSFALGLVVTVAASALPAAGSPRAERPTESDVELVAIDLAGRQTNLTRSPGVDASPAIARDGRVAFVSLRGGRPDVWLTDLAGSPARRVTNGPLALPGGAVAVHDSDAGTSTVAWAPGGARLAVDVVPTGPDPSCTRNCVRWQLATIAPDGTAPRRLAADGRRPAYAPRGGGLAFWAGVNTLGGDRTLTIARADATPLARLRGYGVDRAAPAWAPDGSAVAYDTRPLRRQALLAPRVHVVGAGGRGDRLLGPGHSPSWSAGGRIAAIADGRLYVSDRLGRSRRAISPAGTRVLAAAWSPDGRLLAVVAGGAEGLRVEVVRADGSGRRVLVREPVGAAFVPGVGAPGPVWSPDGRRIVLSLALPR